MGMTYDKPRVSGCDTCDGSKCGAPYLMTSTKNGDTTRAWKSYCSQCQKTLVLDDEVKQASVTVTDPPKPRATNDRIGLRDMWIETSINTAHFYIEAENGLKGRLKDMGIPEMYMVIEPLKEAPRFGVVDEALKLSVEKYNMAKENGKINEETDTSAD